MKAFSMWNEQIIFKSGWFIYMDGKGNNSIISHQRARELELGFQRYQASMDINRGGLPDDVAYTGRGFILIDKRYVYEKYRVDALVDEQVSKFDKVLIIPESINGITINSIASHAFQADTALEKVILTEKIKEIGESAFEDCVNLKEISIPNEHIIIKTDAFKNTGIYREQESTYLSHTLTKVNNNFAGTFEIINGTTAIADEAFKGCEGITDVILPEGLLTIGKNSFSGCKALKTIVLPSSLQLIDDYAFADCSNLKTIVFPKKMCKIGMAAFEKCITLEAVSLPEGITEIERALFNKCESLHEVHIPSSVTKIWFNAFTDSGVFKSYEESDDEELYIDNWLIHYKWKEKKSLSVREGTVGIAGMNWAKPNQLSSLQLPMSLKYIGYEAFNYAPITTINFPQNLEYIDTAAFRGTHLKRITIPKSVKKIEQWAFMDCENLESITVEGSDTEIVWPAITGRRDKAQIIVSAPRHSRAKQYCDEYAIKYNLVFKSKTNNIFSSIFG